MKIRTGFVSNSSTSSFVLRLPMSPDKPEHELWPDLIITKKEEAKALRHGFIRSWECYPTRLSFSINGWDHMDGENYEELKRGCERGEGCSLVKYVTCNQDNILEWLVKSKIPFSASCHYGDETLIYRRDSEFVEIYRNLGILAETSSRRDVTIENAIVGVPIRDFLKGER